MKSTQEIIADGLGERGVPILLIGGMALPAFDVIRQTVDTDCLMATSKETALQDVLIAAGYIEVQRTYNFVRYTSVSVYHSDVDVLLVDDNTFEKVFVDSTPFKVGNATINVPSAENMIMLKLHAMKNNHKRELKDRSCSHFLNIYRVFCKPCLIHSAKFHCHNESMVHHICLNIQLEGHIRKNQHFHIYLFLSDSHQDNVMLLYIYSVWF